MKTTKAYSLDVEVVKAISKLIESGRYKSASAFVERCVLAHFEPEFPDLEGEAAFKRADELEFAAKQYREMGAKKLNVVPHLSQEEQAILDASAAPVTK